MNFGEWLNQQQTTWYHATLSNFVPSIRAKGLKVSENPHWGGQLGATSMNKLFLARTPDTALYYGFVLFKQHLEHSRYANFPILLKVEVPHEITPDPEDHASGWVQKDIPTKYIQVWWRRWMPLATATFIDGDLAYTYNDETGEYEDWEGEPEGNFDQAVKSAQKFYQTVS